MSADNFHIGGTKRQIDEDELAHTQNTQHIYHQEQNQRPAQLPTNFHFLSQFPQTVAQDPNIAHINKKLKRPSAVPLQDQHLVSLNITAPQNSFESPQIAPFKSNFFTPAHYIPFRPSDTSIFSHASESRSLLSSLYSVQSITGPRTAVLTPYQWGDDTVIPHYTTTHQNGKPIYEYQELNDLIDIIVAYKDAPLPTTSAPGSKYHLSLGYEGDGELTMEEVGKRPSTPFWGRVNQVMNVKPFTGTQSYPKVFSSLTPFLHHPVYQHYLTLLEVSSEITTPCFPPLFSDTFSDNILFLSIFPQLPQKSPKSSYHLYPITSLTPHQVLYPNLIHFPSNISTNTTSSSPPVPPRHLLYGVIAKYGHIIAHSIPFNINTIEWHIPKLPYYNSHYLNNYPNGSPPVGYKSPVWSKIQEYTPPLNVAAISWMLRHIFSPPLTLYLSETQQQTVGKVSLNEKYSLPIPAKIGIYDYVNMLYKRAQLLSVSLPPHALDIGPLAEQYRTLLLWFRERHFILTLKIPIFSQKTQTSIPMPNSSPNLQEDNEHYIDIPNYQEIVSKSQYDDPLIKAQILSDPLTASLPPTLSHLLPTSCSTFYALAESLATMLHSFYHAYQSQRLFTKDCESKWITGRVVFKIEGRVFQPNLPQPNASGMPFATDILNYDENGETNIFYAPWEDSEYEWDTDSDFSDDGDDIMVDKSVRQNPTKPRQVEKSHNFTNPYYEYSHNPERDQVNLTAFQDLPFVPPHSIPVPRLIPTNLLSTCFHGAEPSSHISSSPLFSPIPHQTITVRSYGPPIVGMTASEQKNIISSLRNTQPSPSAISALNGHWHTHKPTVGGLYPRDVIDLLLDTRYDSAFWATTIVDTFLPSMVHPRNDPSVPNLSQLSGLAPFYYTKNTSKVTLFMPTYYSVAQAGGFVHTEVTSRFHVFQRDYPYPFTSIEYDPSHQSVRITNNLSFMGLVNDKEPITCPHQYNIPEKCAARAILERVTASGKIQRPLFREILPLPPQYPYTYGIPEFRHKLNMPSNPIISHFQQEYPVLIENVDHSVQHETLVQVKPLYFRKMRAAQVYDELQNEISQISSGFYQQLLAYLEIVKNAENKASDQTTCNFIRDLYVEAISTIYGDFNVPVSDNGQTNATLGPLSHRKKGRTSAKQPTNLLSPSSNSSELPSNITILTDLPDGERIPPLMCAVQIDLSLPLKTLTTLPLVITKLLRMYSLHQSTIWLSKVIEQLLLQRIHYISRYINEIVPQTRSQRWITSISPLSIPYKFPKVSERDYHAVKALLSPLMQDVNESLCQSDEIYAHLYRISQHYARILRIMRETPEYRISSTDLPNGFTAVRSHLHSLLGPKAVIEADERHITRDLCISVQFRREILATDQQLSDYGLYSEDCSELPSQVGDSLSSAKQKMFHELFKYQYFTCYYKQLHLYFKGELGLITYYTNIMFFQPSMQNLLFANDPYDLGLWFSAYYHVLRALKTGFIGTKQIVQKSQKVVSVDSHLSEFDEIGDATTVDTTYAYPGNKFFHESDQTPPPAIMWYARPAPAAGT